MIQANRANVKIDIEKLEFDPALQMRKAMDETTVDSYSELYLDTNDDWPFDDDVVVFQVSDKFFLVDGWHRVKAAKRAGRSVVSAYIRTGTYQDAFRFALAANAKHGLPRSNASKRRAVEMAMKNEISIGLSNRDLAKMCLVSEGLVRIVRKEAKDSRGTWRNEPTSDRRQLLAECERKLQEGIDLTISGVVKAAEAVRDRPDEDKTDLMPWLDDISNGSGERVLEYGAVLIDDSASELDKKRAKQSIQQAFFNA